RYPSTGSGEQIRPYGRSSRSRAPSPIGRGLERTAAQPSSWRSRVRIDRPGAASPLPSPDPHPALRATFSQWEKDSRFMAVLTPETHPCPNRQPDQAYGHEELVDRNVPPPAGQAVVGIGDRPAPGADGV